MLSTLRPMYRRCQVQCTNEWNVLVLFVRYDETPVQLCSHNRYEGASLCPRVHVRRIPMGIEKVSMMHNLYSLMYEVCIHNHLPTIIMHCKIDGEQCGVDMRKIDIWRCVLLVVSCTYGQAGRFERKSVWGQENEPCDPLLMLPINAESDLGLIWISIMLSLASQVSPSRVSTTTEHQYASCSFQPVTYMCILPNLVIHLWKMDQLHYNIACSSFDMHIPLATQRQWHSSDSELIWSP